MKKRKLTINERWEQGIDHDPRSVELYKSIAKIDYEEGGDSFEFKSGGDGDSGDHLMYLFDLHFEDLDNEKKQVVHQCCWAQQGDIQIQCDQSWTEPKWCSEEERKKTQATLPEGVYLSDDDRLYTFQSSNVTCEKCKK